jgi:hypothetical protein
MNPPIALVPKPKAADDVRESVTRLLRDSLDQAERGEVDTVIIILGHPDGEWSDRCSSTEKLSAAIGRLEITKAEWVAQYLQDQNSGDS